MIPIRDHTNEAIVVKGRLLFLFATVLLLTLILVVRLGYLQIVQHREFSALALENRIDLFSIPPVRGLIFDRNGHTLASNVRSFNLEILLDKVDDINVLLDELGQIVELTPKQLERFRSLAGQRPSFEIQTLKANLSEKEAAVLSGNLHRYPGVRLQARLQRHYPEGELTAHSIGYVGRIGPEDMEAVDRSVYQGIDYIGKSGIEDQYEEILRGTTGVSMVETNAHGRVIRHIHTDQPDTGKTIHLSLDIELQEESTKALEGYEGAIVAIDPNTGEVLSFVSMPTYDPNEFVNGIGQEQYSELRDSESKPLFNRALYGQYAPGSTIKGFMILIGLDSGVDQKERVFCPGWFSLPGQDHRYRCWKKSGHGWMDSHDAVVQSCDVYFYDLATRLGIDKIFQGMSQLGFGETTGIDLIGEQSGLMPSKDWKTSTRGVPWFPGETVITGIGQGYMLVTPLQLAVSMATLANRGKRVVPRFLTGIEHPQSRERERIESHPHSPAATHQDHYFDLVIQSMYDVVHSSTGTARGISRDINYTIAGKTGTAQVKSIAQDEEYDEELTPKKYRDHSLFVGFAPHDDPKIAISVIVEHAGSGSRTAAPIARRVIDFYLHNQLGLFSDPGMIADVVNPRALQPGT